MPHLLSALSLLMTQSAAHDEHHYQQIRARFSMAAKVRLCSSASTKKPHVGGDRPASDPTQGVHLRIELTQPLQGLHVSWFLLAKGWKERRPKPGQGEEQLTGFLSSALLCSNPGYGPGIRLTSARTLTQPRDRAKSPCLGEMVQKWNGSVHVKTAQGNRGYAGHTAGH